MQRMDSNSMSALLDSHVGERPPLLLLPLRLTPYSEIHLLRHCHPWHAPRRVPSPTLCGSTNGHCGRSVTKWTVSSNVVVPLSTSLQFQSDPPPPIIIITWHANGATAAAQSYNRIRDSSRTLDASPSLPVGASLSCALHVRWEAPRRTVRIEHDP